MRNVMMAAAAVAMFTLGMSSSAFADPPGSGGVNGNGCVENCGQGGSGGNGGSGGGGGQGGDNSITNTITNTNTASGGEGGKGGSVDNSGNSNVTVNGGSYRAAASTAHSAALAAAAGTCMGSSSGGVQGMSLGVSFGTTWSEADCKRQRFGSMFIAMNRPDVATALFCQNDDVAKAMRTAGTPCKAEVAKEAAAKEAEANGETWNDPDDDNETESGD